jgi:hypothetical protein
VYRRPNWNCGDLTVVYFCFAHGRRRARSEKGTDLRSLAVSMAVFCPKGPILANHSRQIRLVETRKSKIFCAVRNGENRAAT